MKKSTVLGVAAAVLAAAAPVAAGTVYLPVVSLDQPAAGTYKTRVWITNYGDSPAAVKLLYIPGAGDGTTGRGVPGKHTIAPGSTIVLFDSAGPGLLEIQAPDEVAVNGELRSTALPGPAEVFGLLPTVGSQNAVQAGATLVLQGLRRSERGVRSHLGLMNLGHGKASCAVSLHTVGGDQLIGTTGLSRAPLSHALFADVLALTEARQIGDAHARISCDQPFYAYLLIQETPTGEVVFVRPSLTGASTLEPPGGAGEPGPSAESYVYTRSGTFHKATRKKPSAVFNIPAPENREFRRIVLELDVTHGGWSEVKPQASYSLFWLHRGGCCSPWPRWAENIVGFANAFGSDNSFVRVAHNVDYQGQHEFDKTRKLDAGLQLTPGKTYRFRYVYDAGGGTIRLRISQGGKLLRELTGAATTSRIRSDSTGLFMAYFGHEPESKECQETKDCGPEWPSYGWSYSNLRVEFIE